jgi:two-component system chemotaxis sensor kinase CheA
MSIDLSEFIPVFLEESFEGLDTMESCLLELQPGDMETINTIFRAAHSIKGGSGTFGFDEVGRFTHELETLLDKMRNGQCEATPDRVALLLSAVDCVRSLLVSASEGGEVDRSQVDQVERQLVAAVHGDEMSTVADSSASAPDDGVVGGGDGWRIRFIPEPGLLMSGNDPMLLFRELALLGPLEINLLTDSLPELDTLDPTELHLAWELMLSAAVDETSIREIFEWVEDDCELILEPLTAGTTGAESAQGWDITLRPEADFLVTGNDPLLLFRELAELGALQVQLDSENLPALDQLDPVELRLNWRLSLHSACSEADIRAVFDWVDDQCELIITPVGGSPNPESAGPVDGLQPPISGEPITSEDPTSEATGDQIVPPSAPAVAPKSAVKSDTKPAAKAPAGRSGADSSSIRVETGKVDALIDRVGELVITQAMLAQVCEQLSDIDHPAVEQLLAGLGQLERNTRDLQEDVMRVRMLPISFVFNRFPRVVHDVSSKLGKKVELLLKGEQTELDKTVMEKIGDPLVHLLRNSLDHGLETPAERLSVGKPETGQVLLNAYHEGGYIVIDISDDGRGLNRDKILGKAVEKGLVSADANLAPHEIDELIFLPGFSTADQVSDLSGRGVGMDVVRRNIESLGGHVSVHSVPGEGSRFSVRLPLTLAIVDGQLVRLGQDTYIVPLVSIVETIKASDSMLTALGGSRCLLRFRGEYLPLVNLRELFELDGPPADIAEHLIVVVENAGQKLGLIVDELMGQQQAVIKSLEVNFKRIAGIAGATIMGDGGVALILDVAGLMGVALDPELASAARRRSKQEGLDQ